MVDCSLDVISHTIPERYDATVVFRISTPWMPSSSNYHRTLLGPARKSRKLPLWTERDFLEYLQKKSDGGGGTVLIFVEAVYSSAGCHELLKQTSMKDEKLAGLGYFNVFNSIFGISKEEHMRVVELKDVNSDAVIGTARVRFTSVVWPSLQQKLWGKVQLQSASETQRLGEKVQRLERVHLESLMTPTKKSDFVNHHAKIYNESPDSPLLFSSDTEGISENQLPISNDRAAKPSTPDVMKESSGSAFGFTRSGPVKLSHEARSSPLSPSQKLNYHLEMPKQEPRKYAEDTRELKGSIPSMNVSRRLAANFNAVNSP